MQATAYTYDPETRSGQVLLDDGTPVPFGAAAFDGSDRLAERREIGGEDRGGDQDAHRLTSREIGSPGAIWNPDCGFWRRTMPGGTPG